MKQEDKYFTPSIEDIRVGFECETYHGYGSAIFYRVGTLDEIPEYWNKYIFTESEARYGGDYNESGYDNFCNDIEAGLVRTSFLTKEQIEAEGWRCRMDNNGELEFQGFNKGDDTWYELKYDTEFHELEIEWWKTSDTDKYAANAVGVFKGECKDINTLRYICKLLHIK